MAESERPATRLIDEALEVASRDNQGASKWLSPWTVGEIFAAARDAAAIIAANIDRYESWTDAELAESAEALYRLNDAVVERFMYGDPDGMIHEPQVQEYRRWRDQNIMSVSEEFSAIVRGTPANAHVRFRALMARLPLVVIQQGAIAANAAKGGRKKDANSGFRAARNDAKRLWPEAHRKGWTAERLWTALRDNGHKVKADTVRKWLTKLRNTGTC